MISEKKDYIIKQYEQVAETLNLSIKEIEFLKQLAVIKDVGFGNRNVGQPILWFVAMISERVGTLIIVFKPAYHEFIKDYEVFDVKGLEGKAIWVISRDNLTLWLEPCKFV